ncbi:bifunctional acetaldehyde-CoA/alcohol dehydrogenase [Anaerobium acetethylicum]|uniref:Aldehyde-alcohol dehydrogenase n=1 Tax=Anaerobium acetethylicum TaxID=1619234 RepID=A0A1D3TRQ6_9FIRM|nr:bifunctional acetaldehyde-CoA/alcohol dehydrogenase [Anaerobium acetethylicum]SCP96430.1 acetaldehyde dehydrogenase / alcohol dehydrogenase [Anaerobium acetethylicum]
MEEKKIPTAKEHVNQLVDNAQIALKEYLKLDQETVDNIVHQMALAGLAKQQELAKMAVEETGRGIYEDKITKNIFATEYIWHSIKYQKTVGIIEENEEDDFMLVAEPIGIVAGVTPVTNPTSTTMFKAISCAKTRNPIIFGFHPSAQQCSKAAALALRDAAIAAGAPENCIQWIEYPSLEATQELMNHPGVALILATGGSGMVKQAYSSGKPALGVGPGNVPCFIEKTAVLERAVNDLVLSKSFDNGMICASEQAAVIEAPVYDKVVALMKKAGCYFATKEEIKKLEPVVINLEKGAVNPAIVGKAPYQIAALAGITIPKETKVLCTELAGVGPQYPLSKEKLSPVLAVVKAKNVEDGFDLCEKMLILGGMGHSSVLHSTDNEVINAFSNRMKTGRIIINSPSTHGAIGDLYNTNMPSLTLGCGSYGGNSTTRNVSAVDLVNVKRVAKRRNNMQWFKIPDRIYFESGSTAYLSKMPNITKAFIVTDPSMTQLGYVNKVLYQLRKREQYVHCEIFDQVEPDPSLDTINKGVEAMKNFNPDVIIALGGGSAIDAAKGMWLFYEHPEADFKNMSLKFLDIRKRAYKFPMLGKKAQFVAIPTTSGTGSEVTSFAVISDKTENKKYPLADYELTPDVAIIDPDFVMSVPKKSTAWTGMDVLTHAFEAYVSIMASDYSDALAVKAIELVFQYLKSSFTNGAKDPTAREKMHNASTIAGMAFTNAFLGINHSLAHKLGGEFHVPHGCANAILLPHVIRYNGAECPTKFTAFPKYEHYIVGDKIFDLAKKLGLNPKNNNDAVEKFAQEVEKLNEYLEIPATLKEFGIEEKAFSNKVDELADLAFGDQCTTANPRLPLVTELKDLYMIAYYGKGNIPAAK